LNEHLEVSKFFYAVWVSLFSLNGSDSFSRAAEEWTFEGGIFFPASSLPTVKTLLSSQRDWNPRLMEMERQKNCNVVDKLF
jgi:hypothetical protein